MLALTGSVLVHSTDYVVKSFWALRENFGLVFKEIKAHFVFQRSSSSFRYFSANRYATDRVTGFSVLFILFALVSSFADKNRSWFFTQRYQLLVTTTTIKRDTLVYGGNLFNITKMFSHYFQDMRESVTGFCCEVES